jgi:O-antigen ligase
MNTLKTIGIYLFAFLLPWQTRYIFHYGTLNNGAWEYGTMALYAIDLLIILLFLVVLAQQIIAKQFLADFKKTYWLPIVILLIISCLSALFAFDVSLAWYRVGQLVLGIIIFYIIATEHTISKAKIWCAFLAGALLQGMLANWQFLTQTTFASKWLGMASHIAGELGTSVVVATNNLGVDERWLRAYGSLDHPNLLGGFLAISLLVAVYLIIKRSNVADQALAQSQDHIVIRSFIDKCQIFVYISLIIITAGLFFSFSRTAWIGFGVGLIIMFVMYLGGIKRMLPALFPIIIITGLLGYQHYQLVIARADPNANLEHKSATERIEYAQDSLQLLHNHWLLGVGPGNYGLAVQKEVKPTQSNWYYQPVHNVFLLVFTETGIFGLLAFSWLLLFLVVFNAKRLLTKTAMFFPLLNIILIIVLLIMMLFDHWLWSLHFGTILLWFVLGMTAKQYLGQQN